MQIKTTMRYRFTTSRFAIVKKNKKQKENDKYDEDWRNSCVVDGNVKRHSPGGKQNGSSSKN